MGVGSIFVATTLAPVVVVLASVSLNLLTIGLDQLSKLAGHANDKNPLYPVFKKVHFIINTHCFGGMEIDVKNFNNVMLMAVVMGLVGVALSLGSVEDAALRTSSKSKSSKNGGATTPKKKMK
eukprot:jgi/Undpi1/6500/HiC_scaffold_20.g08979.m1